MAEKKEKFEKLLLPNGGVVLVANGYGWVCPECDHTNYAATAVALEVSCDACHATFPVFEVRHRAHAIDLEPGVAPGAIYVPKPEDRYNVIDKRRSSVIEKG